MRAAAFSHILQSLAPGEDAPPRLIGLISTAIAIGDDALLGDVFMVARSLAFERLRAYEIVLQSYLFLGFPRMLGAAEVLHHTWPDSDPEPVALEVSAGEADGWIKRGRSLCQQVYGELYEPLKRKVESFAPEIFRWMVLEGYGKVLSRPELPMTDRELSIIAFLIAENRPRQLHSHMRGALNCATPVAHITYVINDLEAIAPEGYRAAIDIASKLGIPINDD